MKIEYRNCDIKGCKNKVEKHKEIYLKVTFHNEQTEGRGCEPYLSDEKLDLCGTCYSKLISLMPIQGEGAQGYNTYEFNDLETKDKNKDE